MRAGGVNLLTLQSMKALAAAGLVFFAAHAGATTSVKVRRGDLEVKINVSGTVVPDDVFRIKSVIEGRVERILTSTFTWRGPSETLAFVAHRELAAMLDTKGAQNVDILEERWQRVYRPTAARCPATCFILKNFLKRKTWVKPDSVMFEAAATLKLVGRVRPEDARWVRDGQPMIFWPVKDPKRIQKGRVTRFVLDVQGEKVIPGATFTLTLSPDRFLEPGTEWEGLIVPLAKKDVLSVPTSALIRAADGVYLPVRVSTGITTQGMTEITAGVEDRRDALILDDAQLAGDERYKQEAELDVLRRRALGLEGLDSSRGPAPLNKPGKHATVIDSTDYGEDPYAEP